MSERRREAWKTHPTTLKLSPDVPPEIDCGATLTLRIRVSCPSGCDLSRGLVKVVESDREIATVELGAEEDLVLTAPSEAGEHAWTIALGPVETDGVVHTGSARRLRFRTRPHATSMTVWGPVAPVMVGGALDLKVGVKCSAGCRLSGRTVQVRDERGRLVGQGLIGDAPWPKTRGLYAAELCLVAPRTEQMHRWSGLFEGAGGLLPHEGASAPFSFRTAPPPEHTLAIEVSERGTGAPLEGAAVFLGRYQATTDARGRAELSVPKGTYSLVVRKRRWEAPPLRVEVDRNERVTLQARLVPDRDPDEEEVWM